MNAQNKMTSPTQEQPAGSEMILSHPPAFLPYSGYGIACKNYHDSTYERRVVPFKDIYVNPETSFKQVDIEP